MDSNDNDERLKVIEARLGKIESILRISSVPMPQAPSSSTAKSTQTATPSTPSYADGLAERREETFATPSTLEGPGNWLGLVAIVCFVLAAAFIVKLSIDTGWLTPLRQVGLAYMLGFGLIAAGLMLMRADREYASYLPAGGVIILYLTTFAAYQFFSLFPFLTAIVFTSAISVLCVLLYLKFRNDVYAIIAALGAYVSPLLLGSYGNPIFSLYYFVLCSLAFATISIWVQSRILTVVAAYLAIFINSLMGINLGIDRLIAIVLPIHFIIFSVGTYLHSKINRTRLTEKEAWSFFPVLLLFYAMEYYFIDRIHHDLAPWISLAFAGFLILLYFAARRWLPDQRSESEPIILAFTTIVFFHAFYLELLPHYMCAWLFVAIVLALAMVPDHVYSKPNIKRFGIPMLGLLVILGLEYLKMFSRMIFSLDLNIYWYIVAFAALASMWFLFINKRHRFEDEKQEFGYALLIAAHLLAIAALYNITEKHGSLAISISWLLYAICIMIFGFVRKDKIVANSALLVLSFAAAKVLLYDAAAAPTVVRILCLLFTGAVLYGSGFLFKKIAEWK